uniref:Armadillo-like repeats domain-containing protein n=1 Tax=Oryza punctata TaxID=4537 RepID=A0A0E0KT18_ORYPU
MGQGPSQPAQAVEEPSPSAVEAAPSPSPSPAPASSSLEALAAEAMSFDEDGNEGSDCVKPFIALQDCIKINPEAFSKEILEEEENDEEAEKSNLKAEPNLPSANGPSKPLRRPAPLLVARAKRPGSRTAAASRQPANPSAAPKREADEEVEVEEEMPWIQDKALDLVEFTGTVTQAIPGPRVGSSPVPWLLAVPLAYVGVSFVLAVVRTVRRFTSPRTQKKRRVSKNIFLLKSLDELFQKGREAVDFPALQELMEKTGFDMDDVVRKYIRYTLNEKPFNPDVVVDLIHLRKASMLEDAEVAEILNEISRRIVREKGPVVMDLAGFTEQGFKRKLAVQTLFGKILYLSELPEFCSRDGSLVVKEIFGVTDEDADSIRIHTLSETSDIESLEKMVDDSEPGHGPSPSS